MTKTKRLLSAVLSVVMLVSMLSTFGTAFASGVGAAIKGSGDTNQFLFNPFQGTTVNPGFSTSAPSSIIFVCSAWAGVEDGKNVYMEYNFDGVKSVYKVTRGANAFSSITEVMDEIGKPNLVVKVGAGSYTDSVTFNYSGLKFYGNYAGVNPNGAPTGDINYPSIPLNSVRKDDMESVLSASAYTYTNKSNNITFDGFKMTGMDNASDGTRNKSHKIAASSQTIDNFYFENNIFENCSSVIDANRGWTNGVYVKNNRFTNCGGSYIFIAGGAMSSVVVDNNYFANNTATLMHFTSCGAYTSEALISFSNNTVYNCAKGLNFAYDNANYGANLDYKRIENNVFSGSGSSQGAVITAKYLLEYMKNATDTAPTKCTDTGCKTFISGNTFLNMPANVVAIDLTGGGNISGIDANFIVSVTGNRFILDNKGSKVIRSAIEGLVDASYNFVGKTNGDSYSVISDTSDLFAMGEETKGITMPSYLDFDLTQTGGAIGLAVYSKADLKDFEPESIVIDNSKGSVSCKPVAGYDKDELSFKNIFTTTKISDAIDIDCELYSDFLLTEKCNDMTLELKDVITRGYLLVTHKPTGLTLKYNLVVDAPVDKTKTEIKRVTYGVDNKEYTDVVKNGTVYHFNLDTSIVYFPFELVVSPAATYAVYTDPDCKTPYVNETGYIAPDKMLTLFVKVTGGDGNTSKVYTFNIKRQGSADYDARIFNVVSPETNITVYNNERKTIAFRPYALTSSQKFDFTLSPKSTYEIYEKYDKSTGTLTNLLSSSKDIKDIALGDGICYHYVKVTSEYGYSQVYTLITYNDVRSSDNVITGITGLTHGLTIKDNVIRIEASVTLTAVNAHFEVNPFADVIVYPTRERTFKLEPSKTYQMINNREVEVRTFQLGIENKVSYFFIDVIAETGEVNSYDVIITKPAAAVEFEDISGHWAEDYIKQLSNLGITNGSLNNDTGKYNFSPNTNATRQEMAAFLLRMMGIDAVSFKNELITSAFSDADDIADWSYNYVKGVYKLGIMVGSKNAEGKTVFNPKAKITREEFFQSVSNLLKLDTKAAENYDLSRFSDASSVAKWALPATKAVVKAGIIEGTDGKLNPKSYITRAEIAKIVVLTNTISKDVM